MLAEHLKTALLKPLAKEPDYLTEDGTDSYKFTPTSSLDQKVQHVADWISAAMVNNEPWLADLNKKGKPKVLVDIGSLKQAVDKANIDMRKNRGNPDFILETAKDVQEVMKLEHGYRIVKLLSPRALDRETAMLGHCIGDGTYDHKVKNQIIAYYSLRDQNNQACASMEVMDGLLLQCKGKNDKSVLKKHVPYIKKFVEREELWVKEKPALCGLISDKQGVTQNIYDLPENTHFVGNLNLEGVEIESLPKGFRVDGNLLCANSAIKELPDNLVVSRHAVFDGSEIETIGENIHIGKTLSLAHCKKLIHIPGSTKIDGDLVLSGNAVETMGDNITIGGDLRADLRSHSALKHLPMGMKIGGSVELPFCNLLSIGDNVAIGERLNLTCNHNLAHIGAGLKVGGYMDVTASAISSLPDNLEIGHNLWIERCKNLRSLPKGLNVDGNIYMKGSEVAELPDDLIVSGAVLGPDNTQMEKPNGSDKQWGVQMGSSKASQAAVARR